MITGFETITVSHTNNTDAPQLVGWCSTPKVLDRMPESIDNSDYALASFVQPGKTVTMDLTKPMIEIDDSPIDWASL